MENQDFKVGDLVRLKTSFSARFSHPYTTSQQLGLGVVLEKLSELFVLPNYGIELQYDYQSKYEAYVKGKSEIFEHSVKTRICKVYWFSMQKTHWEYEDDLSIVQDETSNS